MISPNPNKNGDQSPNIQIPNKQSVSNSTRITRPSGSYFEANNKNKNKNPLAVNKTWIKTNNNNKYLQKNITEGF